MPPKSVMNMSAWHPMRTAPQATTTPAEATPANQTKKLVSICLRLSHSIRHSKPKAKQLRGHQSRRNLAEDPSILETDHRGVGGEEEPFRRDDGCDQ